MIEIKYGGQGKIENRNMIVISLTHPTFGRYLGLLCKDRHRFIVYSLLSLIVIILSILCCICGSARSHYLFCSALLQKKCEMAGIRRTWDKALYEQRAKERLERGDDFTDTSKDAKVNRAKQALREEFRAAESNASGPIGSERAFLKARERKLGLEDRAGKVEIINPADAEGQKAGFWCEVCSVLLKDSASYLAHVNGKKRKFDLVLFF